MARARNIKPGFFRNAELVELSFEARLLFIGLWTIADKAGRLEDRPKQIKMELFPADNMDCNELLNDLDRSGMIERYTAEGVAYIKVTNFSKHQNPHKDEKPSVIPDKHHASTVQAPCKVDVTSEPIRLIPETLLPITESLKKNTAAEYSAEFELAWAAYPPRPGANKKDSFGAWKARVKAGVDSAVMIAGAKKYAIYCNALGTDPQYIKQPSTFFGKSENYLLDWSLPATNRKTPPTDNFAAKDYGTGVNPL